MSRPICLPYTGTTRRTWVRYWSPSRLFYLWEGGNDLWGLHNHKTRVLAKETVQDIFGKEIPEILKQEPTIIDRGRAFRWGRGQRNPKP